MWHDWRPGQRNWTKRQQNCFLVDEIGTSIEETIKEMDETNSLEMCVAQVKRRWLLKRPNNNLQIYEESDW